MTNLSSYSGKPDSPDIYSEIAKGIRDSCLTIFRMELDEVYQKARRESRLDAMVDLNEVRMRVEKRIEALNAELNDRQKDAPQQPTPTPGRSASC